MNIECEIKRHRQVFILNSTFKILNSNLKIMQKDKKTKVLIIEDDSYIMDMYKIKFEASNFEVISASDGIMGLKVLEKKKPDIILLDIIMPKMDGFSVLKEIKGNPALAEIPVILLTNLGQRENIEKGFDLGATGYIIKAHFTPSEIVKKIRDTLEKPKEELLSNNLTI